MLEDGFRMARQSFQFLIGLRRLGERHQFDLVELVEPD
jgi:hypothetical protein